jgi:hypothetical protein
MVESSKWESAAVDPLRAVTVLINAALLITLLVVLAIDAAVALEEWLKSAGAAELLL